jgi:chemotaxis regulatin CheY-phosphate phosphatase CheZ
MPKKIKITESQLKTSLSNFLKEELDKDDVVDMFKKNREFEKRVKEISAGVVSELFRILWQRRAFYDDIKR